MSRSRARMNVWMRTTLLLWVLLPLRAQAQGPEGRAPVRVPAESPVAQAASPVAPAAPDEVVITVGDHKITAAEFEKITAALPPQFSNAISSMGKKAFADQYATLLALALEGQKLQIDQNGEFIQMVAFQRLVLLGQLTLGELVEKQGVVSPEEVQSYYAAHLTEFEQVKLRGIYVPFEPAGSPEPDAGSAAPVGSKPKFTEAQAQAKAEELRKQIQDGQDMAALARKESDHATAAQGGDFGYVRHNQFPPPTDSAIFSLQPDQASAPVRDRFGFFIFRVEQKRLVPLEEAKVPIEGSLRQQKLTATMEKLKAEHPVSLNPKYFSEAPPNVPAQPPARPQ